MKNLRFSVTEFNLSAFDKSDFVEILGVIGAQNRQAEGIPRLIEIDRMFNFVNGHLIHQDECDLPRIVAGYPPG